MMSICDWLPTPPSFGVWSTDQQPNSTSFLMWSIIPLCFSWLVSPTPDCLRIYSIATWDLPGMFLQTIEVLTQRISRKILCRVFPEQLTECRPRQHQSCPWTFQPARGQLRPGLQAFHVALGANALKTFHFIPIG